MISSIQLMRRWSCHFRNYRLQSTTPKRPTTPLGMLAWDAREEAARNVAEGLNPHEAAESVLERVATRKIREAMEAGEFENIGGINKSVRNYDLGVDGGLAKMLKNANVAPEWIEKGKQLKIDVQTFKSKNYPKAKLHDVNTTRTLTELNTLNARIRSYNLVCKIPTMVVPMLDPKKEL
jgi:hypothetical protein